MATFQLITKDFAPSATSGMSRDAWLQELNPTWNYGIDGVIAVQDAAGARRHGIFEIVMPSEEDILGFGELTKVELLLKVNGSNNATKVIAMIEIEEIWDEGTVTGAPGECSWDDAQLAVAWKKGGGAIDSDFGSIDAGERVIDTVPNGALETSVWRTFDLTPVLNMGDTKSFIHYILEGVGVNPSMDWYGTIAGSAANRPILRLTYKSYHPEGFTDDKDKLRVIPNPDDQNQPMLTWGGVDADDFLQYKLYRDTSPIAAIDGFTSAITTAHIASDYFEISGDHTLAFPVGSTFKVTGSTGNDGRWTVSAVVFTGGNTRITVDEDIADATADGDIHHGIWTSVDSAIVELIDAATLTNGTKYYYRLIAEDQDNHEDDALRSATVFFTKPDVTNDAVSPKMTPSGAQNVGTQTTLRVDSPQNIKRIFVDWQDGTESWYEFETVGTSKSVTHIYTEDPGVALTPDVRIEDELGFWSDVEAAGNTITPNDTTPDAKLQVNVKKEFVGEDITLNASLSQPKAGNATITKYEFERLATGLADDAGAVVADGGNTASTFKTNLVGLDDAYNKKIIMFTGGALAGEQRIVSDFVDITDFITVTVPFSGTPGAGDAFTVKDYYDNGTNPVHTFSTSDLSIATNTGKVRVTTSTALQDIDTVTYELISDTPEELLFSNRTKIHEIPHDMAYDKLHKSPIDADKIEYSFRMAIKAERITIFATTEFPEQEDDVGIVRDAYDNDKFIRIRVKSELESNEVLYDGFIESNVTLGHNYPDHKEWSFDMIVYSRSVV